MYARIAGDLVMELFTPPEGVSISECFAPGLIWVDVSAVTPQPLQGWLATETGGVWSFAAPPPPPAPTLSQMASSALSAGLAVTSTSTPAINGTYSVDPAAQGRMAAISTFILVNNAFPSGASAFPWIDTSGGVHLFPTTALFQQFATAAANYVAALDLIAATGTGTMPPNSITIA